MANAPRSTISVDTLVANWLAASVGKVSGMNLKWTSCHNFSGAVLVQLCALVVGWEHLN